MVYELFKKVVPCCVHTRSCCIDRHAHVYVHICVYVCVAFHTHDILCTIGYIIYIYICKCMICDAIGDLYMYIHIYTAWDRPGK